MTDIDPQFRELNQFHTDKPQELGRQLSQHEDFVAAALKNVADGAFPLFVPTQRKTAAYTAKLDEVVVANGTFTVTLPAPTAQNAGRMVAVLVESGTITVKTSNAALVQGAPSDTLPVAGLFLYESTGVAWWRQGGVLSVTAGTGLTGGGTGTPTLSISSSVITDTALASAVTPIRQEVEKLRVLVMQLVKLELGDQPDNGWEAAGV